VGTAPFAVPTLVQLFEEGFSITGVITQPDKPSGRGQNLQAPPVKKKAHELHLSVYQPRLLKDEEARALFGSLEMDAIVVVAYGKILPVWLLGRPRLGTINVHGSLLPKYRGAAPIHWAIANGENETGVCTMQVEEGLDTGPVYLCEKTLIGADENVPQLSDRLATMGASLLLRTLEGVISGKIQPQPQDHSKATLAPMIKKHHGFIDWSERADRIHNRVRAFNPWPGTVTRFRGTICKILKAGIGAVSVGGPGTIAVDKRSLFVGCGDQTSLEILQIQPENRKPVAAADFVNGVHIQPGEKFEPVRDN
jgi:methionyl-tRNA formyltransferase